MPLAALLIPTAGQCCRAAWPLVLLASAIWFWRHGDAIAARLVRNREWQIQLGWLDLKTDRIAGQILAAFTHLLHLSLLVALIGILYLSWVFGQPQDMSDQLTAIALFVEWTYLFASYGIWIYYLGFMLYPRVRDEFEAAELARYRLEHPDLEKQKITDERLKVSLWDSGRPRRF